MVCFCRLHFSRPTIFELLLSFSCTDFVLIEVNILGTNCKLLLSNLTVKHCGFGFVCGFDSQRVARRHGHLLITSDNCLLVRVCVHYRPAATSVFADNCCVQTSEGFRSTGSFLASCKSGPTGRRGVPILTEHQCLLLRSQPAKHVFEFLLVCVCGFCEVAGACFRPAYRQRCYYIIKICAGNSSRSGDSSFTKNFFCFPLLVNLALLFFKPCFVAGFSSICSFLFFERCVRLQPTGDQAPGKCA